jgi:hypothetical protein
MEIASSQLGSAVQLAVQQNVLAQVRTQGAGLVAMLATPVATRGSVNPPTQGTHIDARA